MFDTLKEYAKLAEESGVLMNLEPLNVTTDHVWELPPDHPHGGGDDPAHRLPKLKVLYDVYHMQLNEGSLCDNIRAYGDQFGHIHVADAPGPAPGRSTTPMCLPVWRKPDTPA